MEIIFHGIRGYRFCILQNRTNGIVSLSLGEAYTEVLSKACQVTLGIPYLMCAKLCGETNHNDPGELESVFSEGSDQENQRPYSWTYNGKSS